MLLVGKNWQCCSHFQGCSPQNGQEAASIMPPVGTCSLLYRPEEPVSLLPRALLRDKTHHRWQHPGLWKASWSCGKPVGKASGVKHLRSADKAGLTCSATAQESAMCQAQRSGQDDSCGGSRVSTDLSALVRITGSSPDTPRTFGRSVEDPGEAPERQMTLWS